MTIATVRRVPGSAKEEIGQVFRTREAAYTWRNRQGIAVTVWEFTGKLRRGDRVLFDMYRSATKI